MSLDRQLRALLEKHANFHVPLSFGDPDLTGMIGAVIDLGTDDRPVIGHLTKLGLPVPAPAKTGAVDISLSLARSVTFNLTAGASAGQNGAQGTVTAKAKVRAGRDVVVLVEPTAGLTVETDLLTLAPKVAALPSWQFDRWAFVARVFAVANGKVMIAKTGDGEISLSGKADVVSKAIGGELSAGVTWTSKNLYEKSFDAPGVFGVHLVKATKKGQPRWL